MQMYMRKLACGFRFLAKGLKHTSQSYWNGVVGWSRVTATEELCGYRQNSSCLFCITIWINLLTDLILACKSY